jgi:Histidine kinase-, DNA gyrase B-, and HSP90-like ATPase
MQTTDQIQDTPSVQESSLTSWGENAPRGGRAVLGRILKDGATVPLFLGQTLVRSLRNLGYNNTTSAVCEHLDNAIQWGASEIRIFFNQRGKKGEVDVLIVDNGAGMAPNVLKLAMSFGGSMVYDDRGGIGRYGMGMKTAALSMRPVLDVYSWQEPNAFYNMTLDVEEIGANRSNMLELPDPTLATELPAEIVTILTKQMVWPREPQQLFSPTAAQLPASLGKSGTIVYIPNCDRLTYKKAQTLSEHAIREMGRIYRRKLSDGIKIFVNNRSLEAFDPTFWMQDARHVKLPELATKQSRLVNTYAIDIPVMEGSSVVQPVNVRVYSLPFEDWMNLPRKTLKNDLHIFDPYSVSFVRNDREVDIGSFPELAGKAHADGAWVRLQVDFSGELDEALGVAANKQGVRPKRYVYDIIREQINEDVSRIRESVKQFRAKRAEAGGRQHLSAAEMRASETDPLQTKQLPDVPAPRTPEEEKALDEALKAFAVTLKRGDETDDQAFDRVKRSCVLSHEQGRAVRARNQVAGAASCFIVNNKTAEPLRARLFINCCFGCRLVVHAAHSARWHWGSFFLFRNLRDQCFGGGQLRKRSRAGRRAMDVPLSGNWFRLLSQYHQLAVPQRQHCVGATVAV